MISKRRKLINEKIDNDKQYSFKEAIELVKEFASQKFKESIDVSVNLGVDQKNTHKIKKKTTVLPNGTGKTVRVAVFAQGENADKASAAGADIVGFDDLAESIKAGEMNFEVVIATPDAMRIVGQLGQVLGPRGLMPNPKVGTVTADVETAVKNAKAGQVRYRTDKAGIIHCSIGRTDFEGQQLQENLTALLTDLKKAKPSSAKGVYLRKMTVSSTMGPGLKIDQASLGG